MPYVVRRTLTIYNNQARGETYADQVALTVYSGDLGIDSDNNDGYGAPDRSRDEDRIEDVANDSRYPGKYVMANIKDSDGEDIPDFADGYNRDGAAGNGDDANAPERFVSMVLDLSKAFDLTTAKVRFTYDASNPAAVNVQGSPPEIQYTPGAGHLRIWMRDGNAPRNGASVAVTPAGDFVPSGVTLTPAQLGITDQSRTKTLYLEGIDASAALADQRILVEVDPDGDSPKSRQLGFFVKDAARTTVVKMDLRDTADNNRAILGGYVAWITGTPQMPQLQVTVRPDLGATGLSATWKMETEYPDHGRNDQVFVPGGTAATPLTQGIKQPWNIGAAIAALPEALRFFGGRSTLSLTAGTMFQQDLKFRIRGRNPLPADARTFIDGLALPTLWFAYAIAKHESREGTDIYNQFYPRQPAVDGTSGKGQPTFGAPLGWGMYQLDFSTAAPRVATIGEIWNWRENTRSAIGVLQDKRAAALTWMQSEALRPSGRPVGQRPQSRLDTGALVRVDGPRQVGNCTFADGTPHPIEDAVTIKGYNGSSAPPGGFSGFYAAWNGPGPNRWEFTPLNGYVPPFDYVSRVCAEVDP